MHDYVLAGPVLDVLTSWAGETLGGLTVAGLLALWGWSRRRRTRRAGAPTASVLRTYTLIGARAADGQPVHLPSSRPSGTRIAWSGPAGREEFELTDVVLTDGTYAAERVRLYRL